MKAKLIHVEVPTDGGSKAGSLSFYETLFGTPLARSLTDEVESHHLPISRDGTWLSVHVRKGDADAEQIVCHFAVDDLDGAVKELTAAGGKLVDSPVEVGVSDRATDYYKRRLNELNASDANKFKGPFFKIAYVRDPNNNLLALMEVDQASRHWFDLDATPSEAQMLGHEKAIAMGDRFASGETLS